MVKKATSLNTKKEKIENSEEEMAIIEDQTKKNIKPKKKPRKKKIQKKKSKTIKKKKKTDSPMTSKLDVSLDSKIIPQIVCICEIHPNQKIDFLCTKTDCLKSLCSFCILDHKDHIEDIFPLKTIIENNLDFFKDFGVEKIQNNILEAQKKSLEKLEFFSQKIKQILHKKINQIKERLISDDEHTYDSLNRVILFKNNLKKKIEVSDQIFENKTITKKSLDLLKKILKDKKPHSQLQSSLIIEEDICIRQFLSNLQNNINYFPNNKNLNSTLQGVPKYLHWFEWEKRELHLFDVINYTHKTIKLVIPFKVPAFSRSIIIPDGRIFLIGGEDQVEGAKKGVYVYDIHSENDRTLYPKTHMPFKKYDFTLAYLNGYIYVICGKDSTNTIVAKCERYNVNTSSWSLIAPVNKKRYAASVVSVKESEKLFLFGGRSDLQNNMMKEIEEYDVSKNIWKIVNLKWPQEWTPVEVCSTIQIDVNKVLVFGGSDINVEDSKESYVFNAENYCIEKCANLKKAHVFVTSPFLHGNFVFAVGNEYYVKTRNVHRYDISQDKWDIVF